MIKKKILAFSFVAALQTSACSLNVSAARSDFHYYACDFENNISQVQQILSEEYEQPVLHANDMALYKLRDKKYIGKAIPSRVVEIVKSGDPDIKLTQYDKYWTDPNDEYPFSDYVPLYEYDIFGDTIYPKVIVSEEVEEALDSMFRYIYDFDQKEIIDCKTNETIQSFESQPSVIIISEYRADLGKSFEKTRAYYIDKYAYHKELEGRIEALSCGMNSSVYSYNINPAEYGDIDRNSSIDLTDLTILSQQVLKDLDLPDFLLKNADTNADGEVNLQDLALLKQYVMNDNVQLGAVIK